MRNLRKIIHLSVLTLTVAVIPVAAQAQTALVWATGNGPDVGGATQYVANYILQHGCFDTVIATNDDFVPLSALVTYDAVLYFTNASQDQDPVAIGNVLADYADTGRRLVIATWAWADQGANTLAGRIITDEISPLVLEGSSLYTNVFMNWNDGSAYFIGMTFLSGAFHDDVRLTTGAALHATWSDGEPLVADKDNVVGINLFPDGTLGYVSGQFELMFAHAMPRERPLIEDVRRET